MENQSNNTIKQEKILDKATLFHGNNMDALKELEDNSIDSVVTDPPYGLSLLNNKWDYDVPSVEFWREIYRVIKPGGYILSFGGTRTYHRMVVNIEDAGFEIRDQIMWIYGQGFPKSRNIGVDIDKVQGNERKIIGKKDSQVSGGGQLNGKNSRKELYITQGNSEFEDWGTTLKPANEPICVAKKPISKKTIAENVIHYTTGAINIGGCRIDSEQSDGLKRFPTNVIIDEFSARLLDDFYHLSSRDKKAETQGPSRFFFIPKVNTKERSLGMDNEVKNTHPTLKPIELMKYLTRMVTPKNGMILDPFMGSGSTGVSSLLEGFQFIGMEQSSNYFEIAKKRINSFEEFRNLIIDPIIKIDDHIEIKGFWKNRGLKRAS
jgi:site-specific DNA-methyltransferase (adenine-specific)